VTFIDLPTWRRNLEVHSNSFHYVHIAMCHLQHGWQYHLTCAPHGLHMLVYIKYRGRPTLIWNHQCTQQVEYDDILNKISHNNSTLMCHAEGSNSLSDNWQILAVRSQRSVTTKASHLMMSLNTLVQVTMWLIVILWAAGCSCEWSTTHTDRSFMAFLSYSSILG